MTSAIKRFQNKIDHAPITLWLNKLGENLLALQSLRVCAFLGNPIQSIVIWALVAFSSPPLGMSGLIGAASGSVIYKTIKRITKRPRPYEIHEHIRAWVKEPDKYSFPSGHTINSVILSMVLCAINPLFFIIGFLWIFLTGISRVALGLHYTSDVLIGGIIGLCLGSLSILIGL